MQNSSTSYKNMIELRMKKIKIINGIMIVVGEIMNKVYDDLIEQKYIINSIDSFEPRHIFECGQCFRWNEEADGAYIGVINKGVLKVKKEEQKVIITGVLIDNENIESVCNEYFDLEKDYSKIKNELSSIDEYMKTSINYGYGIRILKQNVWETIISFIISANNNIPRIKGIIERLSKNYGNKIIWNKKEYYTFPTAQELSKASVQDLRNLGLGFRDKRVYDTTKIFFDNKELIEKLENENDIEKLREELLRLPGVGPKVADCIMLFGMNKFEVFPIDVWVRRVMNDLYIKEADENKVSKKQIEKIAKEKFDNYAGIAQQYLFYWRREKVEV